MQKTLEERFWEKVNKNEVGGRWIWTAKSKTFWGYGRIKLNGRLTMATHIAWELVKEEKVPIGKKLLHKCDNPPCVNPDHLFLGTQKDNSLDCYNKRRSKNQGPTHSRTKLTRAQVALLKTMYETNNFTTRKLNELFGIKNAWSIVSRRTWKSVA